jgi:hypothetical protein
MERQWMTTTKETKRVRVANDYYPTPDPLITALIERVPIQGRILEPCAGHGAIAKHFPDCLTNDAYPTGDFKPDFELDATQPEFWKVLDLDGGVDWVVTNPPYGELATPIVSHALYHARVGVAMLLRLNWFEPCRDRAELLERFSDQMSQVIIINPRPQFRADTSRGDNITVAWVVWQKSWSWKQQGIPSPFSFLTNWR